MRDQNFDAQNVPEEVKERAIRLGTWGKIKRDPQYQGPERARPEALLDALNVQGNHIRSLQSEKERMQQTLSNLRLRNSIIVALVTAITTAVAEHFLR